MGIPIGLVAVSRLTLDAWHPLPGIGSWDEIRNWFSRQLSSSEIAPIALRILLSLAWLLWAALVVSVASSIAAARPSLERLPIPRVAMFDGLGAWIVAGLTVLTTLTASAARAAPMAARAPVTAMATNPRPALSQPSPVAVVRAPSRAGWETVQPAESIEMFAARTLGAGQRWPEVWELNRHRPMDEAGTRWSEPWRLTAGWELQLPTTPAGPSGGSAAQGDGSDSTDPPAAASPETLSDGGADVAVHRIVYGDTLWDILAGHYGRVDAELVWGIAGYNHLADPSDIPVGYDVVLPALNDDGSVPAAPDPARADSDSSPPEPADATGAAPTVPAETASTVVHVVVDGDTLWDIIEARYGHVDMTMVRWIAAINGIDNPNLIYTGQQIALPDPAAPTPAEPPPATATPAASTAPAAPPSDIPADAPATSNAPAETPGSTAAVPAAPEAAPAATPTPTVPEDGPPSVPPSTSVPSTAPAPTGIATSNGDGYATPTAATADQHDESSPFDLAVRSVWWKVACPSLLAAGIAVMVRRLRGRRWQAAEPGEQLADPPAVAAGTELAVSSRHADERVATLQGLLRTVTPHAREMDDPPPVRSVEFDDDRVEVLFVDPAPFPPPGWTTSDGGRSWVHRLTGDEPAPTVRQLVTPALATLGRRRGGGEVLLDLETAGSTALVGDRAACLGLARSMALELATYPLGVPMDVCLVGVDVDGVEHCDRVWTNTTMARAVRVAREVLERTTATGARSMLAARAALDEDEGFLDPQVFIVDRGALCDADAALLDELVALCQPQAGAATVIIGGHPQAGETVEVDADGSARWSGATLEAPVLSREAVAQVAVTFDHAANAPFELLSPSPVVADLLATAAEGDIETSGDETEDDAGGSQGALYTPPSPDVVVRVMGEVTVEGRGVQAASDVELLTLLVCLRDRSPNIDTITDLLGRAKPAPIQNRLSSLRIRMGEGSDGEPLLPLARTGRGARGLYSVSPLVMTDVELLEHRYRWSLQLAAQDARDVLRGGLGLMAGPAFRARAGYSWAGPEGVVSRIASIVTTYAARLMELAFEADELELVLETARCAGRVIDDPVAEIPMRRLQREYADASGHPGLHDAVVEALRRLSEYCEETDRLAPDQL